MVRNDISHGVINNSGRSLAHAQRLRQQAKDIVSELFTILGPHLLSEQFGIPEDGPSAYC